MSSLGEDLAYQLWTEHVDRLFSELQFLLSEDNQKQ